MHDDTSKVNTPLVTIGVPLFNAQAHLNQCLTALTRQTLTDFEIIVSGNASTDQTRDIVRHHMAADSRIRLIEHAENKGPLANFECVLNAARGSFFLWRAYDDWSDDNYLEALVTVLQDHPDKAFAVPKLTYVDQDGHVAREHRFTPPLHQARRAYIKHILMEERAPWFYGMYRTSTIKKVFADAKAHYPFVWGWDHVVMLPFILDDEVVGTNETAFYIRETGLSASRYQPGSIAERWAMHKAFLAACWRALSTNPLSAWDRILLMPVLFRFAQGKADKLRRIARHTVMDFVQRVFQSGPREP